MSLNWTDIEEIAEELMENHPEMGLEEIKYIKFTDLLNLICEIEGFEGKREDCNEKKLEAVQAAWYEEKEDSLG